MAPVTTSRTSSGDPDCQQCGACCAPRERWKTYVEVTNRDRERLPAAYRLQVLRGELATRPRRGGGRCVALEGELGVRVRCRIHADRPDTCRRFVCGSGACLRARLDVLGADGAIRKLAAADGSGSA